jgi:hypothetical protein
LAKTNLKSDQSNLTSTNGDQPSESDRAGIEKKIRNLKKKCTETGSNPGGREGLLFIH